MIWTFLIALCLVFIGTENAYAYLDPGTGSIILQGIIATVAGALVAGRVYWQRVKTFFAGLVSGNKSADGANAASKDAGAIEVASGDDR